MPVFLFSLFLKQTWHDKLYLKKIFVFSFVWQQKLLKYVVNKESRIYTKGHKKNPFQHYKSGMVNDILPATFWGYFSLLHITEEVIVR